MAKASRPTEPTMLPEPPGALIRLDPQGLIAKALDKGADVATLERLTALAEKVSEQQARAAFYRAKAEFKRRCPPIKKTESANIGGRYSYKYSPIEDVAEVVDPILSALGLSYSW